MYTHKTCLWVYLSSLMFWTFAYQSLSWAFDRCDFLFSASPFSMQDLSSQGSNPSPLHGKHRVLTTGLPGKSLIFFLLQPILCCTFLCRDHVYKNHRQSVLLSIFFLTFILYWTIVDLQCCVSFRCRAKWFSYTYVYSFSNSFPI